MIMEQQNIASFTIESAHPLSAEQEREVADLLAQLTGKTIIYEYMINKDLIAGLRLHSANYLWERSLEQYLRNFTHTFTQ